MSKRKAPEDDETIVREAGATISSDTIDMTDSSVLCDPLSSTYQTPMEMNTSGPTGQFAERFLVQFSRGQLLCDVASYLSALNDPKTTKSNLVCKLIQEPVKD